MEGSQTEGPFGPSELEKVILQATTITGQENYNRTNTNDDKKEENCGADKIGFTVFAV